MRIPSLRFDQEIHYQMARTRTLAVGNRQFNVRQIVDWGAISQESTLRLKQDGHRLRLEGENYKREVTTSLLAKRFLRFVNIDLELELPESCLCGAAREWLAQPDLKLMLMVKGREVEVNERGGQVISKMISLYVLTEQESGEKYGLFLLNS